jgi:iron(III)-enterobactin esterase
MTYTFRNRVIGVWISSLILMGARVLPAWQTPPPSAKPIQVGNPTRDPHTEDYVKANELPDGQLPAATQNGNFVIGPNYTADSDTTAQEGVPQGRVAEFTIESKDSKIYPGIAREPGPLMQDPANPGKLLVKSHPAPYTRSVAVYIPKQYVPGTEAPFIVGADGPDRMLFATLDNLIAKKRVPVMIAISIGNGSGDAQGSQRGLEYDTMSGTYAEFVETEILPQVETRYGIKLTRNPEGRATMGCSSGAAAALAMAWYRPDLYHRVLSYSGTYVYQQWPDNPATPHGAWDFHDSLIPNTAKKPLRLWLEVGDADNLIRRDDYHDWVLANERMAKVLATKGYTYQFVFAKNAKHCDRGAKANTLPLALEYVWQGYKGR